LLATSPQNRLGDVGSRKPNDLALDDDHRISVNRKRFSACAASKWRMLDQLLDVGIEHK
jgi:hypothetical protein